ncbi:MAG: hypothetical protein NDI90_15555 [Nitrospira sp. BO4]|nr:hypothetical protein [Nitrospira sp. BO4]
MADYRQSIRDYILASRRLLELGELTDDELEVLQDMDERLVVLFGDKRDHPATLT